MTPQEYCQNKAGQSGSSFYYSFLFLPEEKRNAITALYAFCREVDDIVDNHTHVEAATVKLDWWRTEIENMFAAKANHPVTLALMPIINDLGLKKEYFLDIITGMEMDLSKLRYKTFEDLSDYCYRVASVVGLLSVSIFGYKNKKTLEYAIALGQALQLTNIIRDVGEDAMRNRIYLPQDDLDKFSVTEKDILSGNETPEFYKLMAYQSDRAEDLYKKAYQLLPDEDRPNQVAGIIMASVYQNTLNKIRKTGYHTIKDRVSLNALHKFWIAWKTYRHEKQFSGQLQ